jgi:hypothetical protein
MRWRSAPHLFSPGVVLSPWCRAYLVGGAPAVDRQRGGGYHSRPADSTGGTITLSRHSFMMAGHQRKIYQNDTGQSWWLCRHEEADAFILFEEPSDRRIELQISDFFNSELFKACTASPSKADRLIGGSQRLIGGSDCHQYHCCCGPKSIAAVKLRFRIF